MGNTVSKVGLIGLIAIVFGSMIGGGIFNISQNMAAEASLAAVVISWIISGIGVGCLVYTFKTLSDNRPDITSGIFGYAEAGFGRYAGFNSAWGYWLSAALGNIAFAVMVNDALAKFFPVFQNHGWQTILLGSICIWAINFFSFTGSKNTNFLNTISTIAKFLALLIILGIIVIFFQYDFLSQDFWGKTYDLSGLGSQIKSTMLVTLWCFIGVEGAVVISNQAKKESDVGKATVIGFLLALAMYATLSILSFGIMTQPELAKLTDPSVGGVIAKVVGNWGQIFVNISVLISVLGGWIAWTILVGEVPYDAAKQGVLPAFFKKENKNGAPTTALMISSAIMQLGMFAVVFADNVYVASITISGVMILPSYLLSSMYLYKASKNKGILKDQKKARNTAIIIGILSTLYCLWLIYAAGTSYLLLSTIFYALGIPFYRLAHKDIRKKGGTIYTKYERILEIIIIALALLAIYMLATNHVSF